MFFPLRRSTPLLAIVLLSALALADQQPARAAAPASTSAPAANRITNGTFSAGTAGWSLFPSPAGSMESRLSGGVFEWNRTGPASSQAAIFQTTGDAIGLAPLEAAFDIGNSANIRQRMSVLLVDADFSDVTGCTFWLEPFAPMRTYRLRTHTNKPWANAAIYFYAATSASQAANGGFLRLDNVSFDVNTLGSESRTDCVDPTTPPPPGGPESASLVLNGDFNFGMAFWQVFGTIQGAVAGGVFHFIRNPGQPAGVIFQTTNAGVARNEFLTARFDLGNSSPVRKRVTAVVHAADFSDLAACTFLLQPGQPLSRYVIRMRATRAWAATPTQGATLSLYGSTVGSEVWIQFDNASLTRSPGASIAGTECIEPEEAQASSSIAGAMAPAGTDVSTRSRPATPRTADADAGARAIDGFTSWMAESSLPVEIQASADGSHWVTVARVPPGEDWADVDVDVSAFGDGPLRLRLVYMPPGVVSSGWRVIGLRIVR